jgi:hypothetical protein
MSNPLLSNLACHVGSSAIGQTILSAGDDGNPSYTSNGFVRGEIPDPGMRRDGLGVEESLEGIVTDEMEKALFFIKTNAAGTAPSRSWQYPF